MTPVVILLLLLIVGSGRAVQAQLRVTDAAHSAARAASLARDPATAVRDAQAATQAALPAGATCAQASAVVDTTHFSAGGTVTVTVTCSVKLTDLGPLKFSGGFATQSRTFTSPVDTYRGTTP